MTDNFENVVCAIEELKKIEGNDYRQPLKFLGEFTGKGKIERSTNGIYEEALQANAILQEEKVG